jgi:hypothetical protein
MMNAALVPFMLLAAVGFLLSVAVHVATIAGIPIPGGQMIWTLHVGIFVVWIPTVLITSRIMRGERRQDLWKVMLSGCPAWMRLAAKVLLGYIILNFIYFMATSGRSGHHVGAPPPSVIRGFSGHWMLFYGVAFMTLYSVNRNPALLRQRVCRNGHTVSSSDQFCAACGESLGVQRVN